MDYFSFNISLLLVQGQDEVQFNVTLIDDELIENVEQIDVPLGIVSGNGLGTRANNDVAIVFIFDNNDSKTFDTMINLTYNYIMKISLMNI